MWLPSLRGLRAVEAALRLGSFAAAAKDLGVTQTAISRLVKEVERQLARPLFERRANQSRPTTFALSLQSGLGDGFRRLEATVAEARRVVDDPTITREVTPGPDTLAAIRLAGTQISGFTSDALFSGRLTAVCRPDIAKRLKAPADLAREQLLDVRHSPEDWPRWLTAAGLPDRTRFQRVSFDFSAFAIQAALDGLGVALVRAPYITDDLREGRLVAPFSLTIEDTSLRWRLIYRP